MEPASAPPAAAPAFWGSCASPQPSSPAAAPATPAGRALLLLPPAKCCRIDSKSSAASPRRLPSWATSVCARLRRLHAWECWRQAAQISSRSKSHNHSGQSQWQIAAPSLPRARQVAWSPQNSALCCSTSCARDGAPASQCRPARLIKTAHSGGCMSFRGVCLTSKGGKMMQRQWVQQQKRPAARSAPGTSASSVASYSASPAAAAA